MFLPSNLNTSCPTNTILILDSPSFITPLPVGFLKCRNIFEFSNGRGRNNYIKYYNKTKSVFNLHSYASIIRELRKKNSLRSSSPQDIGSKK